MSDFDWNLWYYVIDYESLKMFNCPKCGEEIRHPDHLFPGNRVNRAVAKWNQLMAEAKERKAAAELTPFQKLKEAFKVWVRSLRKGGKGATQGQTL